MDRAAANRSRTLTDKDRQTMELMIEGKRDREIGVILGIPRRTVIARIARVCDKLGALTRAQAAAIYARIR